MLGDSYLRIQEPERAIEAYEQALELCKNASSTDLASKIAQTFISTHEYNKAIRYYEDAIRNCRDVHLYEHAIALFSASKRCCMETSLRQELSELFLNLGAFKRARDTLEHHRSSRKALTKVTFGSCNEPEHKSFWPTSLLPKQATATPS